MAKGQQNGNWSRVCSSQVIWYFTFRQTRRSVPMAFSMIFVQASDRAQFGRQAKPRDSEHLAEPF